MGAGSVLPPDVKRIYIPIAENNSTEPGLSNLLTESLRDQFDRFGVLTVVEEIGDADAVLQSKIMKVKRAARTTTGETDRALQYDTTMTVAADLKRINGTILWRNQALAVTKSYGSSAQTVVTSSASFAEQTLTGSDLGGLGNREVQRGQQGASLQSLSDEAARQIYNQAVAPDF